MGQVSSIKVDLGPKRTHSCIMRNEMNISHTTSVMMMYLFISLEEHVKIIGKKIAVKFIHEAYHLKFINVRNI